MTPNAFSMYTNKMIAQRLNGLYTAEVVYLEELKNKLSKLKKQKDISALGHVKNAIDMYNTIRQEIVKTTIYANKIEREY